MPFGIKVAPSKFQKFVTDIFKPIISEGHMSAYMDDFLVATETIEMHLQVLERVFEKLVANKLELRLDKCSFMMEEVEFLGYLISNAGVKPNEAGVRAIREFPIPKDVRALQCFLGLASYFRKFIENFSIIAKPLYDLLRKNAEFVLGDVQIKAIETLRDKLSEFPVLAIYSPLHETELHCDASKLGYGSVLIQRKDDGHFHPIFYFSKRTSDEESRYHSYELETLSIVYALRRFRVYLQGIRFKIVTDCNALVMTLNKAELNPRIARWALEFQNYDYVTEHRPGVKMQHVDALSRSEILVIEDNTFEFNLSVLQSRDKNVLAIRDKLEKTQDPLYEMRNGLVYRKKSGKLLFYIPAGMEREIIHMYHNDLGHFAV